MVGHDRTKILGRTTSATLDLTEDDHGLRFAINPPNTATAAEILELIGRGDLNGCSFRFYMFDDPNIGQTWSYESSGVLREITQFARIADVTITADPAYSATEVSLRSLDQCRDVQRQRDAWSTKAHFALRLAEAD